MTWQTTDLSNSPEELILEDFRQRPADNVAAAGLPLQQVIPKKQTLWLRAHGSPLSSAYWTRGR